MLACCFMKKELETCGNREEFICKRPTNWNSFDSCVTHQRCFSNLKSIGKNGLPPFIRQQSKRLQLLTGLLKEVDDGRSKSFYCLSTALLPPEELRTATQRIGSGADGADDRKRVAKSLREAFAQCWRWGQLSSMLYVLRRIANWLCFGAFEVLL